MTNLSFVWTNPGVIDVLDFVFGVTIGLDIAFFIVLMAVQP
jgi:hypothetical protein